MILPVSSEKVVSSMTCASTTFKITANAKAFEVLTDRLYKKKVLAVIRELSTNALDAHVDAGKAELPFEVHLPSQYEPYFSIRDFGPGMSESQIMSLYTTFFASSKTERNDQIGALGLGSKSPFAVVDSFTIESYQNGIKGTYTCVKNTGGPEVIVISSEATEEQNGLKVSFVVAENMFREFVRYAAEVYFAFDIHPLIMSNCSEYASFKRKPIPDLKSLVVGNTWKLLNWEDHRRDFSEPCNLRMGSIIYPIDKSMIKLNENNKSRVNFMLSNAFLIDMPLGECDIAPSREELNYDDTTCYNICKRLEMVFDECITSLLSDVDKQPTLWEAMIHVRTVVGSIRGTSYIPTFVFKYKGKEYPIGESFKTTLTTTNAMHLSVIHHYSRTKLTTRDPTRALEVMPSNRLAFVNGPPGGMEKVYTGISKCRLRLYAEKNQLNYLVVFETPPSAEEILVIGEPKILNWEDLPRPAKRSSTPRASLSKEAIIQSFKTQSELPMPTSTDKYYLIVGAPKKTSGFRYVNNQGFLTELPQETQAVKAMLNRLSESPLLSNFSAHNALVTIRYSRYVKFKDIILANKHLIPFQDYIRQEQLKIVAQHSETAKLFGYRNAVKSQFNWFPSDIAEYQSQITNPDSPFAEVLEELKNLRSQTSTNPDIELKDSINNLFYTLLHTGFEIPELNVLRENMVSNGVGILENITLRYPFLALARSNLERMGIQDGKLEYLQEDNSKPFIEHYIEYINMIDLLDPPVKKEIAA